MSEEERKQFLEARDLFVNAELERIAHLLDEALLTATVQVVSTECFASSFTSSSDESSPMRFESASVRQLIADSHHPIDDCRSSSSEEGRTQTNEEISTTFILGLSAKELEDFLAGQQNDEMTNNLFEESTQVLFMSHGGTGNLKPPYHHIHTHTHTGA